MLSRLETGKKLVGANQCRKAIISGVASMVFIAEDADSRVKLSLIELCRQHNVEIIPVSTMEELGRVCGINVGAAAAALLK